MRLLAKCKKSQLLLPKQEDQIGNPRRCGLSALSDRFISAFTETTHQFILRKFLENSGVF
jgi:hypothetical protein